MAEVKIKNKGTTALFENRFLEALTRTHFAFPVTLYLVVSVAVLLYAGFKTDLQMWRAVYMVPFGALTFSLVEYCIHRFVFHFHPTTERGENIKYKIHGVHHEFPKDKDRLVMPPVLSIVLALLFYGIFSLLTGQYVLLFFPGFLSGYSIYLFIHYAVHRFRPPQNFLKILWTHHALHHYKSEDTAFGVSMPMWDYLFRTMPVHPREVTEAKQKLSDLL